MKKILLLTMMTLMSLTSCSNDRDENNLNTINKEKSSVLARESSDNPYGADAENPKILDPNEYPLSQEQTGGVAKALGSRCKTTAYFHGVNTPTMWFHVECSGTHYIIAYYEDTGYWGHPHVETDYDTGIWHGGHKREAGKGETPEEQAAADVVQADQRQALAIQTDISTNRAISCHTSYLNDAEGHACVNINGQTFNVSWTNISSDGGGHMIVLNEPVYTATPVKTCRC